MIDAIPALVLNTYLWFAALTTSELVVLGITTLTATITIHHHIQRTRHTHRAVDELYADMHREGL